MVYPPGFPAVFLFVAVPLATMGFVLGSFSGVLNFHRKMICGLFSSRF